jgi:zinc D-Ala-D-Ala carboxypeptidase
MENISDHMTYAEATRTSSKAPNVPTPEHLANIKLLAKEVFEPLRVLVGDESITINSVYRSKEVNAATKGASKTSQHCKGEAMDLDATNMTNAKMGRLIMDNLDFDQLIFEMPINKEPQWIHVSYSKKRNRKQVLIFTAGKYIPFKESLIH